MHRHLTISDDHFERLEEILAETLADHGLSDEDVRTIVERFEQRRALIVD
jgi:hypothetical protein